MKLMNVIVTGPPSSGKSMFIKTLSEQVFHTPEQIAVGKSGHAYTIEFGRMSIRPGFFLYLAGLPSDESFQFVWERLVDGLLGFVVIFDAKSRAHMDETKSLIKRLKNLTDTPFVVVLNRLENRQSPEASELKKDLGIPREEQVVCCDAKDKSSAKQALNALLNIGIKQLKKVSA